MTEFFNIETATKLFIAALIIQILWWAFKDKLEHKKQSIRELIIFSPVVILVVLVFLDMHYNQGQYYAGLALSLFLYNGCYLVYMYYSGKIKHYKYLDDLHHDHEIRLTKLEKKQKDKEL